VLNGVEGFLSSSALAGGWPAGYGRAETAALRSLLVRADELFMRTKRDREFSRLERGDVGRDEPGI
jgi:hypothetical protein